MGFDNAETKRQLANMILIGLIAEVDHDAKKVRVEIGELLTQWLPWPADVGRNYVAWRPLREDTQVVLACPNGDPAQAVIIQTLYTDAIPSPASSPVLDMVEFNDGTLISYDSESKELLLLSADKVSLMANGDIDIIAMGKLNIEAQNDIDVTAGGNFNLRAAKVNIAAPVEQTGGDMTSDGISVQHHKHPAGTPLVGEPV